MIGKNILTPVVKELPTVDSLTREADEIFKDLGPITFEVEPTVDNDGQLQNDMMQGTVEPVTILPPSKKYTITTIVDNASKEKQENTPKEISSQYKVQVGVFLSRKNADDLEKSLMAKGFDPEIEQFQKYWRVFLPQSNLVDAQKLVSLLKSKGFEAIIRR